jgi:hypothetical protein
VEHLGIHLDDPLVYGDKFEVHWEVRNRPYATAKKTHRATKTV